MAIITTDDLKKHALWLAGEPTDGASDYDVKVVDHMQTVYDTLLNGGTLGTRDVGTSAGLYNQLVNIPTTDWMWLRKHPPYAFVTTPAIKAVGTVTVTNGSATITFSSAPAVSVAGWRLKLLSQAAGVPKPPITVPRIASHVAGATSATLDAPWPQETQTVSNYVVFLVEYPLPSDFVRFCEAPMVHGGWAAGGTPPRLNVGSSEQVGDQFPLQEIEEGIPTAAARVSPTTIQLNRWDTQSYRIEFPYIFTPVVLVVGATPAQEPLVPQRFRHVLSIGAAMLVSHDRVDGRTTSLASQFREIVAHMGNEYRKEQNAGSELAGRHLYRSGSRRRGLLRTTSGLPLF